MLSLTLRGFNISIRVLCMSSFYLGSKSSGCIVRDNLDDGVELMELEYQPQEG